MKNIIKEVDIQIRFADVDILGHVNNVNQQHYFDLGKNMFFYDVMGVEVNFNKHGIITAATETSYLAQSKPNDKLYVETRIEKVGNKSVTVFQRLISRITGEVKTESRSVMVAFNFEKQESIPIPQEWKDAIGA